MQKIKIIVGFVWLWCGTSQLYAEGITYSGKYSQIDSSGGVCDSVFTTTEYSTKHFLVGPNHLTSVVYFADDHGGFFAGMSLVGNMGASNDIYAEKSVTQGNLTYDLIMDGLVDTDILMFNLQVSVKSDRGFELCHGKADYFGEQEGFLK